MTVTIYTCADCRHPSIVHTLRWDGQPPRVGPCSMGGCACRLTPVQVETANPPHEVTPIPAIYNNTTGKWLRR